MNVDQMPAGIEMDALIAEKVIGAKWDESRCRVCGFSLDPDGKMCRSDDCSMRPVPARRADAIAPYSTDIAAAWQVVERLRFCVVTRVMSRGTYKAIAKVSRSKPQVSAHAETAPLAICRAALVACGKQEL